MVRFVPKGLKKGGLCRPEIVFYDRDEVRVIKMFEGYAKTLSAELQTPFFTILKKIHKINRTKQKPVTLVSNLTTTKRS